MKYDWKCRLCQYQAAVDRPMADSMVPPHDGDGLGTDNCEHEWYRLYTTGGFQLEGSGWYRDGYK